VTVKIARCAAQSRASAYHASAASSSCRRGRRRPSQRGGEQRALAFSPWRCRQRLIAARRGRSCGRNLGRLSPDRCSRDRGDPWPAACRTNSRNCPILVRRFCASQRLGSFGRDSKSRVTTKHPRLVCTGLILYAAHHRIPFLCIPVWVDRDSGLLVLRESTVSKS